MYVSYPLFRFPFAEIDVEVCRAVVDSRRDGVPHVDGEAAGGRLVRHRTQGLKRHLNNKSWFSRFLKLSSIWYLRYLHSPV